MTSEGGILQALLNMHVKKHLKNILPNVRQRFSNNLQTTDVFDCFGIHLGVPRLVFFKGGFVIDGKYSEVPVREESCLELDTNALDFLAKGMAPQIIKGKINQLDTLYDHIETVNPTLPNYLIKPSDAIEVLKKDGI